MSHSSAAQTNNVIELPLPGPCDYLGPGQVVGALPHELSVELRGGRRVTAEMALAFPYRPEVGDVLLVIGKDDAHYVIGVLHGAGRAVLSFPGEVELRAEGGPLTMTSDHGVAIKGPTVEIETGKLQTFAASVVQKCTTLYQRVVGALDVRAGQAHTIVDGDSLLSAKNASIVTEEAMNINGDEIHLG